MDFKDFGRRESLRLSPDVIDNTGLAIFQDTATTSSHLSNDDPDIDIAPWLDIPPTPPPKSPTTRNPQHKASFGGLSLKNGRGSRSIAPSESSASLYVPDSKRRSADDGESSRGLTYSGSSTHSGDLRKAKSSMGLNILKVIRGRPSKSHLRSDSDGCEGHPSLRPPVPALPDPVYNTPSLGSIRPTPSFSGTADDTRHYYSPSSSASGPSGKEKEREREKERVKEKEKEKDKKEKSDKAKSKPFLPFVSRLGQSSKHPPSPPPPKAGRGRNTSSETYVGVPGAELGFDADLNLDNLEGIVDFGYLSTSSAGLPGQRDRQHSANGDPSSFYISYPHHDSSSPHSRVAQPNFSNPWFSPTPTSYQDKRRVAFIYEDGRKVSPKTMISPDSLGRRGSPTDPWMSTSPSTSSTLGDGSDPPKAVSWEAPESWLPMDSSMPSGQASLPEEEEDNLSTEDERTNHGVEIAEIEEACSSDVEEEFEGRRGSNSTIAPESYLGSWRPNRRRKTEGDADEEKLNATSSVLSLASTTVSRKKFPFVSSNPTRKFGSRPSAPSLSSATLVPTPSVQSLATTRTRTTSAANSIYTIYASTVVLDLTDRKSVFEDAAQGPMRVNGPRSNVNAPGPSAPYPGYLHKMRVRTTGTGKYHLVSIGIESTVQQFCNKLHKRYKPENPHVHHDLYLTEQGRERILQPNEQPAQIVRNRLTQAGYDFEDSLHLLGPESLGILLKFVYKSQDLSGEEQISYEDWKSVDLSGRGLRTIPVALYQQAEAVISLKLSRNPITEIPKDFIQSCTTLRELKLSNMAIKKVPLSVQYSPTLHRLDISCNNIKDLDEPLLDKVKELRFLNAQNNRLEKLPWYLPRLENLVMLNISNNKFTVFPAVVTLLVGLKELDISFNMIPELPEAIGNLRQLDRLVLVSNQIVKFPDECDRLVSLRILDCRRNQISDLSPVCTLPMLSTLNADYNLIHGFEISLGPNLTTFTLSHNDITSPSIVAGPISKVTYPLTSLDLSYAQLSTLDQIAVSLLPALRTLNVSHNKIRSLPETLGNLQWLEVLTCTDNKIDHLPETIGNLQKLEVLDAHNNCLAELPQSIWNCRSLAKINVTSNSIENWHDPPVVAMQEAVVNVGPPEGSASDLLAVPTVISRKTSTTSILTGRNLPPLVHSLRYLYLGENDLKDNAIQPLAIFHQLRVLNLAYNKIQDLPPSFFRNMAQLEELYLSGNKLTNISAEDLPRLTKLTTLFLNGNKLQTLPQELTKVASLATLDVGSNVLRYNINNYEFDWNWNFNKNLKYLNLSGNSRLQIKPEQERAGGIRTSRHIHHLGHSTQYSRLSGFTDLTQLHVLGLMDVTITTTSNDNNAVDIPDENPDRRVRTSTSTIGGMGYGIADSMGKNDHLSMLDLVHEYHGRKGEAIFAMFGRVHPVKVQSAQASPNLIPKFLHDNFINVFTNQMHAVNEKQEKEGIPVHLRRDGFPKALHWTFLKLNQDLHEALKPPGRKNSQASIMSAYGRWDTMLQKGGASGIVVYIVDKMLFAANVGDSLAVVCRQGFSQQISKRHEPFDREEIARIRSAEGYVTPSGLVNNEVDVSRSFGYYHMFPPMNARPDIFVYQLSELDEFVIIANRGLWDYVPFQTAVDIARSVHLVNRDAMLAAQKLRDLAISYGADGSTMVMVISVIDLFQTAPKARQPTLDPILEIRPRPKRDQDHEFRRLGEEVPAPIGHITLVFTDIRNSTHLWEANPGIQAALRTHNHLLRRQLRFCGGYEVKTEGDSFMCSFPTALAGLWWCLTVQLQLLDAEWPLEILECEDGKPVEVNGHLLARGLSVRMGIHCGLPLLCEPDPITKRMDYFGPMVNRSARIMGSAQGGQILCSLDVMREINARINDVAEEETEYSRLQSSQAIEAIKRIGIETISVGEMKLKGLELPEMLTAIYPKGLKGRYDLKESSASNGTRVQFSVQQMRELGFLCLRMEALASGRVFQPPSDRKESIQSQPEGDKQDADGEGESKFFVSDPDLLLPSINDKSSDSELNLVLDSLSIRIENASYAMAARHNVPMPAPKPVSSGVNGHQFLSTLQDDGELDQKTLDYLKSVIERFEVLS